MNGTIRVQCRTQSEWLNIGKVTPFLTIRLNSHTGYFFKDYLPLLQNTYTLIKSW
jgi:hypothetical protein